MIFAGIRSTLETFSLQGEPTSAEKAQRKITQEITSQKGLQIDKKAPQRGPLGAHFVVVSPLFFGLGPEMVPKGPPGTLQSSKVSKRCSQRAIFEQNATYISILFAKLDTNNTTRKKSECTTNRQKHEPPNHHRLLRHFPVLANTGRIYTYFAL